MDKARQGTDSDTPEATAKGENSHQPTPTDTPSVWRNSYRHPRNTKGSHTKYETPA